MLNKTKLKESRTKFYKLLKDDLNSYEGAKGRKSNWLNYPLGLKNTYFRLEFDDKGARLCIDLQHRDLEIRDLFWQQWQELSAVMKSHFSAPVQWESKYLLKEIDKEISRITIENGNLSFYANEDWDEALVFLKTTIIEWDEFWSDFKGVFQALK